MSSWLRHTVDCIVLNVGLVAGFWAWTACSTVLAARWESRRGRGHLTVRPRIVSLSVASAIPLVGVASVLLLTHPEAEILGLRQLTIAAPLHLWIWAAWLVAEPLVTLARLKHARRLLAHQVARTGAPVVVSTRWAQMLDAVIEAALDGSNYAHR